MAMIVCVYFSLKALPADSSSATEHIEPDYGEMLSKYDTESTFLESAEMTEIYTHEDEETLMNVIMTGNCDEAVHTLEDLFNQVEPCNREMANYLVMNLIRTLVKLISNIKFKRDDSKYKFEHMLRIIKLDSIESMKSAIVQITSDFCNEIRLAKPDTGESVSKRVKKYVEENYSNHDLDVSKISDFIGFSPAYAIKLFKQETSEGISSYINRVRVEKAKELLMLDMYRVEQIAKMVGFLDSRALSRSFKRFYGVTPTQYRDISSLEINGVE